MDHRENIHQDLGWVDLFVMTILAFLVFLNWPLYMFVIGIVFGGFLGLFFGLWNIQNVVDTLVTDLAFRKDVCGALWQNVFLVVAAPPVIIFVHSACTRLSERSPNSSITLRTATVQLSTSRSQREVAAAEDHSRDWRAPPRRAISVSEEVPMGIPVANGFAVQPTEHTSPAQAEIPMGIIIEDIPTWRLYPDS